MVDECVSGGPDFVAGVRPMTDVERATADYALRWSRTLDEDDAMDRLCEWANKCERWSHSAERRGDHALANAWQLGSEFADELVSALV